MQDPYYKTTRTALAAALFALGNPLVHIGNVYTPEILRKLRYRDAEGRLIAPTTAHEAFDHGLPGEVTYLFERSQQLEKQVKAWGAEESAFDAGNPFTLPNATAEEFMAMACAISKNAGAFNKFWRAVTPMVLVPNEGETTVTPTHDGGKIVTMPGFRMCSVNASKATKERLGIE